MPLTDTSITDWHDDYTGADTNTPTDSQSISGQLDDEVRNIKSVVRGESNYKNWEQPGLTPTYVSSTSFTFEGDQRDIAIVGRKLKATVNSRTVYGFVSNASYTTDNTTIACTWDLVKFTESSIDTSNTTANTIRITGNYNTTDYFRVTSDLAELWNASYQRMPIRYISSGGGVSYNGTHTIIETQFPGVAGEIDLTVFNPDVLLWKGYPYGINSEISAVEFGPYTPDTFQSGLPNRTIGGTFNVVLSATTGPFTINFPINADTGSPIELHNNTYILVLQPTGVVSGSPGNTDWTLAYVSTRNTTNFNITLPSAVAGTATVQFDYFICMGN